MDRDNTNLLIITIVFIAVMGGGALLIVGGYFVSQSATSTVPAAPQTFGRTFAIPQQQNNPYQQFSDTIADLTLQLEEDPENVKAYRERGFAYEQLGDLTSAMDDYNAALKIDPENVETLQNRANLYTTIEEFDNALEDYNTLVELGNQNYDVFVSRASVRDSLEDYQGAVDDYTFAMDLSGDQHSLKNARAWANRNAENLNDAIDDYADLIKIHPDYTNFYYYRAYVWRDLFQPEKAISDIKRALRGNQNDVNIQADYAWILHEAGRFEEALVQADKAVQMQAFAETRGTWLRTRIKRDLKDYEGAYIDIETALAYEPDNLQMINERAWISWAKGDLTRANEDFERLVKLDPSDFYWHMYLGVNLYHLGDYLRAQEHLDIAVSLEQTKTDYAQLYRWLSYVRAGEEDKADEFLREFKSIRPPYITDFASDDWSGKMVEFVLGDLSKSELLDTVQTDLPLLTAHRKCTAFFYMGSLELIAGNKQQAVEYFKQSTQGNTKFSYGYQSATTELRALGELE